MSSMWLAMPQEQITKRHVFSRDWTTCSKYKNYSRLDSQHKSGTLCQIDEHENLHFDNE